MVYFVKKNKTKYGRQNRYKLIPMGTHRRGTTINIGFKFNNKTP